MMTTLFGETKNFKLWLRELGSGFVLAIVVYAVLLFVVVGTLHIMIRVPLIALAVLAGWMVIAFARRRR